MIILPYSCASGDGWGVLCFFHSLSVLPENNGRQLSESKVILVANPMGVLPSMDSRILLFEDDWLLAGVDREEFKPQFLRTLPIDSG